MYNKRRFLKRISNAIIKGINEALDVKEYNVVNDHNICSMRLIYADKNIKAMFSDEDSILHNIMCASDKTYVVEKLDEILAASYGRYRIDVNCNNRSPIKPSSDYRIMIRFKIPYM